MKHILNKHVFSMNRTVQCKNIDQRVFIVYSIISIMNIFNVRCFAKRLVFALVLGV